jgi:hypothetical protein
LPEPATTEKYAALWKEHVAELKRLKWNLPQARWAELDASMANLNGLVDAAAEQHEADLKKAAEISGRLL